MIHDVLRKHDLPEDLAFTAMIESGFNPVAVSRAGAKGLWQFMADTGRRYGLRVDSWVDERLDPEKSTAAAAAYLRDLYKQFGSWILALAAYNAGEMTVVRAIRATGSDDFWTMVTTPWLQTETKEFVPQIHAATMIGRDPDRYGFDRVKYRPEPMDRVVVPPATDLRRLAISAGLPPDTLRDLNPVLIRGVSPPNAAYELRVPPRMRQAVQTALGGTRSRLATVAPPAPAVGPPRAMRAAGTAGIHIVRPRETVTSIARRYGVSTGDVLRWNALGSSDPIRPGDRLRVGQDRPTADPGGPATR
jgi:membrane-bound lytic murein transglycosylase D